MRGALRSLARRPGFALLAIATPVPGIAAVTVVFSIAYGVLLSPLPYANAGRGDPGADFGPVTIVLPADLALGGTTRVRSNVWSQMVLRSE